MFVWLWLACTTMHPIRHDCWCSLSEELCMGGREAVGRFAELKGKEGVGGDGGSVSVWGYNMLLVAFLAPFYAAPPLTTHHFSCSKRSFSFLLPHLLCACLINQYGCHVNPSAKSENRASTSEPWPTLLYVNKFSGTIVNETHTSPQGQGADEGHVQRPGEQFPLFLLRDTLVWEKLHAW